MKIPWKIVLAFYMPLHFAFGCFYVASRILDEKVDCRSLCTITPNCANFDVLMWLDFFMYSGVGLLILSIALPLIVHNRERKVIHTSIFN